MTTLTRRLGRAAYYGNHKTTATADFKTATAMMLTGNIAASLALLWRRGTSVIAICNTEGFPYHARVQIVREAGIGAGAGRRDNIAVPVHGNVQPTRWYVQAADGILVLEHSGVNEFVHRRRFRLRRCVDNDVKRVASEHRGIDVHMPVDNVQRIIWTQRRA